MLLHAQAQAEQHRPRRARVAIGGGGQRACGRRARRNHHAEWPMPYPRRRVQRCRGAAATRVAAAPPFSPQNCVARVPSPARAKRAAIRAIFAVRAAAHLETSSSLRSARRRRSKVEASTRFASVTCLDSFYHRFRSITRPRACVALSGHQLECARPPFQPRASGRATHWHLVA